MQDCFLYLAGPLLWLKITLKNEAAGKGEKEREKGVGEKRGAGGVQGFHERHVPLGSPVFRAYRNVCTLFLGSLTFSSRMVFRMLKA